jgi:hypothetical protein
MAVAYPFLPEYKVPMRFILGAPAALIACSVFSSVNVSAQDQQTNPPTQTPDQPTAVPFFGSPQPTNTPPETPTPPSAVQFFGNPQTEPASASGYAGALPAAPLAGTSQLAAPPPITQAPALRTAGLVHWGFIHLYPFIGYDVSYGNNLQSAPGQHVDTLINALTPGILIRLGDHWNLSYAPTLRFYSSSQFKDSVDQIVNLSGVTTYQDWLLSFSQGYSATSQPLIETGSQLNQDIYSTTLGASHSLGSHLSLDMGVNQNFRFIDQNQQLGFAPTTQSLEWSTLEWLNYKFAPRLSAGIGVGFTYDDVSPGSDMVSEQFQGRINWVATDKFTFSVSGGIDYREFLSSPTPNLLSPLFAGSVQYHLFENTILSLTASSSVTPSYYENSVSQVDSVMGGLHQRLFKYLALDLSGGYNSTTYHQTTTVVNTANVNNYETTSVNARLSTVFFKALTVALYYQQNFVYSNNGNANSSLYNYTTKQGGLSLSYHF